MHVAQRDLDRVFSALADPTRRGMLERLAAGVTNVSTLAAPYKISQPAASKHLRVLERAGLIRRTRCGREHHIAIDPRPIQQASNWISYYAKFWNQQFDAVDSYLKTHPASASDSHSTRKRTPARPVRRSGKESKS